MDKHTCAYICMEYRQTQKDTHISKQTSPHMHTDTLIIKYLCLQKTEYLEFSNITVPFILSNKTYPKSNLVMVIGLGLY